METEMDIEYKINIDLKEAMVSKNIVKLNVIRGLKTAFTNAAIAKGNSKTLSDNEMIQVIRKQYNQREDSIKQFLAGGRQDLAEKEKVELNILKNYLPEELSDEDLNDIIDNVLSQYDSPTKKDMGGIIKKVIELADGRADNKRISKIVGEKL